LDTNPARSTNQPYQTHPHNQSILWAHPTISDLLDAGVDLATVQKVAGHSTANTTAKYVHEVGRAPFGWRHRRGAP
jgi:site-specific recombinase XerD